jgi:hypothetical protein
MYNNYKLSQLQQFFIISFLVFFLVGYSDILHARSPVDACRRAYDPHNIGITKIESNTFYETLYFHLDQSYNGTTPPFVEVKSSNPKYSKIKLYPYVLERYSVEKKNEIAQRFNLPDYSIVYLYLAYVELSPTANSNAMQQLLLFYSTYNIEGKRKSVKDISIVNGKEIANQLDVLNFVVTENHKNITLPGNEYIQGKLTPTTFYGTTSYVYNIHNKFTPTIKIDTIGKVMQYKPNILSGKLMGNTHLINYNKEGKINSSVEYTARYDGKYLPIEYHKIFDTKGEIKEIRFETNQDFHVDEKVIGYSTHYIYKNKRNTSIGHDMSANKTYFSISLIPPTSVEKKWRHELQKENTDIDILEDLKQLLGKDALEDKALFKEFIQNFTKLNDYVFIDESKRNSYKEPIKYIYRGTYNKQGVPHGWGLMFVDNHDNLFEYYIGHFNNGIPDGLGLRNYFSFDKPTVANYTMGLHVGSSLVYGAASGIPPNNYGYYLQYGDHRKDSLNGKGIKVWYKDNNKYSGSIYFGDFLNGAENGYGTRYDGSRVEKGLFENYFLVSGNTVTDKEHDGRFSPGVVVLYNGQKRVIMKKEKGLIYLDNGATISTKADISLTGEYSVRKKICNICGGTGYLKPETKTIFSGTTQKTKTYETGPTGYILWEKTTTTTTAPVTVTKSSRCTCLSGTSGTEPVPLGK